jgi:hypothetical protein
MKKKEIGIEEWYTFIDKQSGKDFDRPKYQAMRLLMREGDLVYIDALDRLGRDYDGIISEWKSSLGAYLGLAALLVTGAYHTVALQYMHPKGRQPTPKYSIILIVEKPNLSSLFLTITEPSKAAPSP